MAAREGGSDMRIEPTGSGYTIEGSHDAFRLQWDASDWAPVDGANSAAGLSCAFYIDPEAGPGQVQTLTGFIRPIGVRWETDLAVAFIDRDGKPIAGLVGKTHANADTPGKAKMPASRTAHGLARGGEYLFRPTVPIGGWRPGDWVIDTAGRVWVRASGEDAVEGRAWGNPPTFARRDRRSGVTVTVPPGRVDDATPAKPLTLLLRDGFPHLRP